MNNNKSDFPKVVYVSNKDYDFILDYLEADEEDVNAIIDDYEKRQLDWDNDFRDENGDL